jgi:hypothetical protein
MAIATGTALALSAAATAAGTAASISASRKASAAQKDALLRQQDIAANLKYEPINIENLKEQTRQQAIANATQSLALERELRPDVAATRQMAAERVRSDLALGGQLSPDVANQVARASRTMGAMSGAPAGPLTAAQIGLTAEGLRSQRLTQANQLLQANPLMPAGLDPGALASAIVSQNAAMNQFNAAKAGVNANLAQSAGQVNAAAAAREGAERSALINAIPGLVSGFSNLSMFQPKTATAIPDLGFDASKLNLPGIVTPTPNIPSVSVGPLGT